MRNPIHNGNGEKGQRSAAAAVLATAQSSRPVIQDFCPLADSLDWQLGQRYLHQRGSWAFLSDARPVPYVINNDGTLSRHAATLLFTSLQAADQAGALPPRLAVLELGIGVGLFARLFLDTFRDLCHEQASDYYDRLVYVAADRSEPMLVDACRHGLFANHAGHYLLRVADALHPDAHLPHDVALAGCGSRPFQAVFLNYLLDCLPATVLDVTAADVRQLCVRTCLARGTDLAAHTDLSPSQLTRLAASVDPRDQAELLTLYPLFTAEYAYQPVDVAAVPYADFAVPFARQHGGHVLHNYGALQCLERLLPLVPEQGFILLNDYGPTEPLTGATVEHQHFSQATFIGVNFPLLQVYFTNAGQSWTQPEPDRADIHARLLGHRLPASVLACFQEQFGKAAVDWLEAPIRRARELAQAGRLEAAASSYQEALERQPSNWVLLGEVALFLTVWLRQPKAGADLAKLALDLNPISSDLWNTLGDSLFDWGRTEEARAAYGRAVQLNGNDVRARYNLAWCQVQHKEYTAALHQIAEGLALDRTGAYHEQLLAKQTEVLSRLALRHRQEALRAADRIATATPPEKVPSAGSAAPDRPAWPPSGPGTGPR